MGLLVNRQRRLALEQAWLDPPAVLPESLAPSPEEEALTLAALQELDALFDAMSQLLRSGFWREIPSFESSAGWQKSDRHGSPDRSTQQIRSGNVALTGLRMH